MRLTIDELQRNHRFQMCITVVLMLISMYVPYRTSLSYVYQISVALIITLFFGASCYTIMPIIVLSTTRSYIAVSTNEEFVGYLGINSNTMLVIIICIIILALIKKRYVITVDYGRGSLILFALLFMMSRLWAVNDLEYVAYTTPICLMYIVFPFLIDSNDDILVAKYSFTVAGLFGALGIIPHMLSFGNIYQSAVAVDRNYQACFFLICLLQTVTLMIDQRNKLRPINRIGCWISILFDIYIIVVSASRSAFLSLVIAGFIYLLQNAKHFKKAISATLTIGITGLFLYELGALNFILERFSLADMSTGNGRIGLWIDYIDGFSQGNLLQILFGHGLVGQTFFGRVAHNIIVSVLYSFGVVGFVLILVIISQCIISSIRTDHPQELISFLPIMFMCCTIDLYYRIEFAVYLSLMIGITRYYKLRSSEKYARAF